MALKTAKGSIPKLSNSSVLKEGQHVDAQLKKNSWLKHAVEQLMKDEIEKDDIVAWSALHVSMQTASSGLHPTLTQLLTLFYEKAATAATI